MVVVWNRYVDQEINKIFRPDSDLLMGIKGYLGKRLDILGNYFRSSSLLVSLR
jgi:hypothetical protein